MLQLCRFGLAMPIRLEPFSKCKFILIVAIHYADLNNSIFSRNISFEIKYIIVMVVIFAN